ncbi:MAG TPA: MCP four helix bundle domain-containing protein [Gemmataceae bacterium]|nr:MCP four helix bundle domain-containing protein [Gemmataceae bacterium]
MKWFKPLRTSVKLMSGFALAGLLMGVIGWLGISSLERVNENVETLHESQMLPSLQLADTRMLMDVASRHGTGTQ